MEIQSAQLQKLDEISEQLRAIRYSVNVLVWMLAFMAILAGVAVSRLS
jgi:hypothetical protein